MRSISSMKDEVDWSVCYSVVTSKLSTLSQLERFSRRIRSIVASTVIADVRSPEIDGPEIDSTAATLRGWPRRLSSSFFAMDSIVLFRLDMRFLYNL